MPARAGDATRLEERIARARRLADEYPAAAEILSFYAELAEFQRSALGLDWSTSSIRPIDGNLDRIVAVVPDFLSFLRRAAPPALADAAADMDNAGEWRSLLERYWSADAHDPVDMDETPLFVIEALLQPFVEALARARAEPAAGRRSDTRAAPPARESGPLPRLFRQARGRRAARGGSERAALARVRALPH